jgi:hypothetical protein
LPQRNIAPDAGSLWVLQDEAECQGWHGTATWHHGRFLKMTWVIWPQRGLMGGFSASVRTQIFRFPPGFYKSLYHRIRLSDKN